MTPITRVFSHLVGRKALLRFSSVRWQEMTDELERRAGGTRESGAFLLARRDRDQRSVAAIVYFDDLDHRAVRGGIELGAAAFARLWDRCRELDLRVIGDVHTHPAGWVCQSDIDRANPMIAQAGHVAVIVPNLAAGLGGTGGVGVHLYRGDQGWSSWCRADGRSKLYVGRWA
jgi:hypothetical protein